MTEQQQEEVAWWCNAAAAGGRRMAEPPPLSHGCLPRRDGKARGSHPCASGGGTTGGTRARLPQTGRRGMRPPHSPGELSCRRQLELEDGADTWARPSGDWARRSWPRTPRLRVLCLNYAHVDGHVNF